MSVNTPLCLVFVVSYSVAISLSSWVNVFTFLPPFFAFMATKFSPKILKKLLFLNLFILMVSLNYIFVKEIPSAVSIFLRSNLILLFTLSLFYDKSPALIAIAAFSLGINKKLGVILFLSCKFIEEFKIELSKFNRRQKARNFQPKTSIFTYKTYANFVGLLLIGGVQKSKKTYQCMQVRGFNLNNFSAFKEQIFPHEFVICAGFFICLFSHFMVYCYG